MTLVVARMPTGDVRAPATDNWFVFECTLSWTKAATPPPVELEFWNSGWSTRTRVEVQAWKSVSPTGARQTVLVECCPGDPQRSLRWRATAHTELLSFDSIQCRFRWSSSSFPRMLHWSDVPHLLIGDATHMIRLLRIFGLVAPIQALPSEQLIVLHPRQWSSGGSKMHTPRSRLQVVNSPLTPLLCTTSCLHTFDHEWISRVTHWLQSHPTSTSLWLWLNIEHVAPPSVTPELPTLHDLNQIQQWYVRLRGGFHSDANTAAACCIPVHACLVYIHDAVRLLAACTEWLQNYQQGRRASSHVNIELPPTDDNTRSFEMCLARVPTCYVPQVTLVVILDDVHDNYYFDKLWQSMHEQTFVDWECVAVNNATHDDGARWLPYLASLPGSRLRNSVVNCKEKRSIAQCRNLALELVRTTYVVFWEQSVHSIATRLEEQWSTFHRAEQSHLDVVLANALYAFCGQFDPNHTTHKYNSIARHCVTVNRAPRTAMYRVRSCTEKGAFPFIEPACGAAPHCTGDAHAQRHLFAAHLPQVLCYDTQEEDEQEAPEAVHTLLQSIPTTTTATLQT